jgi:hypothetical protein
MVICNVITYLYFKGWCVVLVNGMVCGQQEKGSYPICDTVFFVAYTWIYVHLIYKYIHIEACDLYVKVQYFWDFGG